jgi:hypothetical protein
VRSTAVLQEALKDPEAAQCGELVGKGHPVVYLQKDLTTDFTIGPEILRLSLPGDNPEEAARLTNAVARALVVVNARQEQGRIRSRLEQLSGSTPPGRSASGTGARTCRPKARTSWRPRRSSRR